MTNALNAAPDVAHEAHPASYGLVRRGLAVVVSTADVLDPAMSNRTVMVRITEDGRMAAR